MTTSGKGGAFTCINSTRFQVLSRSRTGADRHDFCVINIAMRGQGMQNGGCPALDRNFDDLLHPVWHGDCRIRQA
jgi:hypothetical protein